ncbi:MAG: hypothetical protein KC731_04430 [Myxococcales bacterium]|nr:hypothetical protein [Myxococcales bacterium]
MRATTSRTADTTEWLTSLWQKLQPWTLASAVTVTAFAGAPALDTLGLPSGEAYVAKLGPSETSGASPASTENLSLSLEEQVAAYGRAQREARLAIAILTQLRADVALPEVQEYLDTIDSVLDTTPDATSLEHTQSFSLGLHAARLQLLNQASSLRLWLKVADALNPDAVEHRVPHRFVVWDEDEHVEEPLRLTRADLRVRRAVARFFGDDGDPAASRS